MDKRHMKHMAMTGMAACVKEMAAMAKIPLTKEFMDGLMELIPWSQEDKDLLWMMIMPPQH